MKYEIVNIEKKILVGKSVRTTNENNKAAEDIGASWQEFIGERMFEDIANRTDNKAIGLYTEYEGDASKPYTFMCACQVSSEDKDSKFETKIIDSGKYAKFTIKGDMIKDVIKVWTEIWNMDLDRKYTSDFEVYHNDSEDMSNQTIDIFISLN